MKKTKRSMLGALVVCGATFGIMQSSTKEVPKSISDLNAMALSVAYGETYYEACENWTGATCRWVSNGVEHISINVRPKMP